MNLRLPILSRRKAGTIGNGVFLIILGVLFFTDTIWPGILFALGINLAIRQFLTGRRKDFMITVLILILFSIVIWFSVAPSTLLSLIFVLLGIYLIGREYFRNGF